MWTWHAQFRQTRNILRYSIGIKVEPGNVQLQANSVDGNSAVLKVLDHCIDRVGFPVEAFPFSLVIKQQRSWIGIVGPAKGLLDISCAFVR